MAKMNPYLNFDGTAEEAFTFYKSVFGGEFLGDVYRMNGAPGSENLPENERNRVMHIALPINESTTLMASDILPSAGHKLMVGNNNYIMLQPESRDEADRLFKKLSEGGQVEMPLEDQFWGAYYGSFADKYGTRWMINFDNNAANN